MRPEDSGITARRSALAAALLTFVVTCPCMPAIAVAPPWTAMSRLPIDRTQGVRSPLPQEKRSGWYAVVTTTNGDLYTEKDDQYFYNGHGPLKVVGHFQAGQHLCLIDNSPYGLAEVTGDSVPTEFHIAYIRNKGELEPDTSPHGCYDVAVWASQYNPLHTDEKDSRFQTFAERAAAIKTNQPMTWADVFWDTLAATVASSVISAWILRAATSPQNRARQWERQKHKYRLDKNTGAWGKIKSYGWHGSVLISTESRAQRAVQEQVIIQMLTFVGVPGLSFLGSLFWSIAFADASQPRLNGGYGLAPIWGFMGTLVFLPIIIPVLSVNNWIVIDPAPVLPDNKPFGPEGIDALGAAPLRSKTAQKPGHAPDASHDPDLTYKPNS